MSLVRNTVRLFVMVVILAARPALSDGPTASVVTDDRWDSYQVGLARAIQTHPLPCVRDTLGGLIRSGRVLINFEEGIAMGGEGESTVFLMMVDGMGYMPVLNISPQLVMTFAPTPLCYRNLYHQYILLRSLLTGAAPAERYLPFEKGFVPSWEKVRPIIEDEWRAYIDECKLVIAMQWPSDPLVDAYALGGEGAMWYVLVQSYAVVDAFAGYRDSLLHISSFPPEQPDSCD